MHLCPSPNTYPATLISIAPTAGNYARMNPELKRLNQNLGITPKPITHGGNGTNAYHVKPFTQFKMELNPTVLKAHSQIIANATAALIRAMGMAADNQRMVIHNQLPEYHSGNFDGLIDEFQLSINDTEARWREVL